MAMRLRELGADAASDRSRRRSPYGREHLQVRAGAAAAVEDARRRARPAVARASAAIMYWRKPRNQKCDCSAQVGQFE